MTEIEWKFFLARLAQRLKKLRLEYQLTCQEVADYLDVDHSTYSRYERGIGEPEICELVALAQLYHTSTDYLLGHTNNRQPSGLLDGISNCKQKRKTNKILLEKELHNPGLIKDCQNINSA